MFRFVTKQWPVHYHQTMRINTSYINWYCCCWKTSCLRFKNVKREHFFFTFLLVNKLRSDNNIHSIIEILLSTLVEVFVEITVFQHQRKCQFKFVSCENCSMSIQRINPVCYNCGLKKVFQIITLKFGHVFVLSAYYSISNCLFFLFSSFNIISSYKVPGGHTLSRHTTTFFQRPNNVVDVQTTLYQRCINVKTTSFAYLAPMFSFFNNAQSLKRCQIIIF